MFDLLCLVAIIAVAVCAIVYMFSLFHMMKKGGNTQIKESTEIYLLEKKNKQLSNDLSYHRNQLRQCYRLISKAGNIYCSSNCRHLAPNEREQFRLGNAIPHFCTKYNVILSHESHHPNIVRCEECVGKDISTLISSDRPIVVDEPELSDKIIVPDPSMITIPDDPHPVYHNCLKENTNDL
jgi:hypothetical protein